MKFTHGVNIAVNQERIIKIKDMERVELKETGAYKVHYLIFEYKCPVCSAGGEVHLEEDAAFMRKEIKCHKCTHPYIIETQ